MERRLVMTNQDRKILIEFATRVRDKYPGASVWAYGSRARGSATWDSDFDIGIVLESMEVDTYRTVRETAWEVGFEHSRVITTLVFAREEFETGPSSESTLVSNILREGVAA